MQRNLNESRILIVGGLGVLGSAIAANLETRGARVVRTSRKAGAVLTGDLRDRTFPATVMRDARALLGALDGVIVAAGVVAFGPLTAMSDATLDELMEVNVLGPIRLMREFAAAQESGFFVNISGVVAETPFPGLSAYGASKAALSTATRAFALEMRRKGLTVIDARPPHTETGLATRAIAGNAPTLPKGLAPEHVAERIVQAIESDEREIPARAFSPQAE